MTSENMQNNNNNLDYFLKYFERGWAKEGERGNCCG